MTDCIFCKLARGEIPTDKVFESDTVLAFNDIDPKAPHHILIIPKKHIATLNDLDKENISIITDIFLAVKIIASQLGIADSGYRTVFNCNRDGGQEVYHLHLHLLGGRKMTWPPG
ncbi:MAG: histidine triad nucleotide-binding protein [Deltaproteobacteria bacterium]|nr:histidine triad nucleotide-binding protein [Deltaproteobacteria bacterium]